MILFSCTCSYSFNLFKKKEKPYIVISSSNNVDGSNIEQKARQNSVFETGERIYFYVYNPDGFKSDYIKYQIVKQDDNAHIGGYTRIRNITKRISDKYKFSDYVVLSQKGKYFIQIFDIENLQQWVAIGSFLVVEK